MDEFILLALCAAIYSTFRRSGWAWKIAGLLLTIAAFTIPLIRLWQSARGTYYTTLGLLPWSDASGYYNDASMLVNGGVLGPFSGRRPLFPAFLAVLLWATDGNLIIVFAGLTCLTAVCIYILAELVNKSGYPLAGTFLIFLSQFYYRNTAGTTMTEQLGLPLGALALALMLWGINTKKLVHFATGLTLLTFALMARAGTFFILPTLVWSGIYNFGDTKKQKLKIGIILSLFIFTVGVVSTGLGRIISEPGSMQMGNFSYTLYGLAVGGKGWTQVIFDHPELKQLSESERSQKIYKLAFDIIKQNPKGLVVGTLLAGISFFLPANFGFMRTGNVSLDFALQTICTILLLSALGIGWLKHKDKLWGLLLVGFAGFFISLPLAPPSDATWMRAYAATIPFLFLLMGMSVSAFVESATEASHQDGSAYIPATLLGFGMIVITFGGALFLRIFIKPHQYEPIQCMTGQESIVFRLSKGAYVSVVDQNTASFPTISENDYYASLAAFPGDAVDTVAKLKQLSAPVILAQSTDLRTGKDIFIAGPPDLEKATGKIIVSCGAYSSTSEPFYNVHKFHILNPQ